MLVNFYWHFDYALIHKGAFVNFFCVNSLGAVFLSSVGLLVKPLASSVLRVFCIEIAKALGRREINFWSSMLLQ